MYLKIYTTQWWIAWCGDSPPNQHMHKHRDAEEKLMNKRAISQLFLNVPKNKIKCSEIISMSMSHKLTNNLNCIGNAGSNHGQINKTAHESSIHS